MKSFEEYEKTARPGRPFSNSSEWEIWQYSVCLGRETAARRCVNDDQADQGEGCPLILLALLDSHPAEWTGPRGQYRCSEKTTPAQQRAAFEAAEQQRIEDMHYPMFPEVRDDAS